MHPRHIGEVMLRMGIQLLAPSWHQQTGAGPQDLPPQLRKLPITRANQVWALDTRTSRWLRVMALIGYSVPIFWLGLMGLLLFYAKLDWVAGPGRMDVTYEYTLNAVSGFLLCDAARAGQWDAFGNVLSHLILSASLLGYFSLAYISRMTRSFMLNELAQEYVVAARAKGLSEARIIWRHSLRNAMVPLVTMIALSYAGLLEGSVLTETVFAWPGWASTSPTRCRTPT